MSEGKGIGPIVGGEARLLAKLLDAATIRHRVIASNLANASNPDFKRKDVRFDEALSKAIASGKDVSRVRPEVFETGERVELETEMGRLAQNSLAYKTWAEVLARKLAIIRTAITGR